MKFGDVIELYKELIGIENNFYLNVDFSGDIDIVGMKKLVDWQSVIATRDLKQLLVDMKEYIREYIDVYYYNNDVEEVSDVSGESYIIILADKAGDATIEIYKISDNEFVIKRDDEIFKIVDE